MCVSNFAAIPHSDFRLGLPAAGEWREVVNTDAPGYGGSGWSRGANGGATGDVVAIAEPWHGRPASAVLQLPPAGVVWLVSEK